VINAARNAKIKNYLSFNLIILHICGRYWGG